MSIIQNLFSFFSLTSSQTLWSLWMIMLLLFLILTLIFSRDWRRYALEDSNFRFGQFIYFIISIFLLGFSAICIILFNANL